LLRGGLSRERAEDLWVAVAACNDLLREARETGFVQPGGWTLEELESLVEDLTKQYVEETGTFADPRG
jgi:hypothetical protein